MNVYDDVPYSTFVQEQTHPDRMNVVASLFGLHPVALENCRVLEVGCGDGSNLIPQAYVYPNSNFVGIDLAEKAIGAGNEAIRGIGLRNISLWVQDLTAIGPDFGEFDYILAHGVYAWVPDAVRDGLLRLCREHLAEQGIAFISYNALPGGHLRRVARDLMLFHTRGITDAAEKVKQAQAILNFAAQSTPRDDYYRDLLREREDNIHTSDSHAFFHDDLAEVYEPVYVEQFVAHAATHDLTYVAEADFFELNDVIFPSAVREKLNALSAGDPLRKEQYMDFLSGRAFRQSLICRKEAAPARTPIPERIRPYYVSTMMEPGEAEGQFVGPLGTTITTNHPQIRRKITELGALWPSSLPVESVTEGDPLVENYLFQLYASNLVKLHAHAQHFTLQPGERPEASAVARYQAIKGEVVATLTQFPARIEGETARKFLLKLDGTRTREELAEEMEKPLPLIEENLNSMAHMALLVR